MSDSDDDDLLPNNVFTFQNDNTTISARGPNINNTNITGLSFRNNVLTSTMRMPMNFERQQYGGSNFDQRSMSYRRETSPMSLRSVPDYRPRTFNHSSYQNGIGIQRSMYNGRGGSPMSLRSIDSTASVSAADIVFAFKNVKFNKYDLRIIKDAYKKLIKTRQRKRIEKRRNLKLFLKGTRRKSGEDSGEQGSDSSTSSDDCRSVRTTICKENIPSFKQSRDVSCFNTNMQRGKSNFNTNMKEIPMYKDCTENMKQHAFRNMMSNCSSVRNCNTKEKQVNKIAPQYQIPSPVKIQNTSVITQKERFTKGFVLPSKRFNRTITEQPKDIVNNKKTTKAGKNGIEQTKLSTSESGSDQEQIFKEFSVNQREPENFQRKRSLESEDSCHSNKKKNKLDLPKQVQNSKPSDPPCNNMPNDFIFAKPKIPIKKGNVKNDYIPEKLLAKSRVPPIAEEIDFNFAQNNNKPVEKEIVKDVEDHSNSDISMRPSFIKRKLFTQKLDVTEHKNANNDSLGVNSPQNIYSASIRERNKTRKLVTSQSCLSREVPGEDNNVLDLIHKIVPPDQMNMTNVANKTEFCTNKPNDVDNNSKWDVTAVIASCDNQDISDTYTDEEIFNVNYDNKNSEKKSAQSLKKAPECKIVVQKLQPQMLAKATKNKTNDKVQSKLADAETSKKTVTDCVKSFWDTDIESDMEFNAAPAWKNTIQQNQETVLQKTNSIGHKLNQSIKKPPVTKGTILTVRNCHKDSILNNSIKSHRSLISSDNKVGDLNKPNSVQLEKDIPKVGKNNKETNSTSQTGKKKNTIKENVPVNNKTQKAGRSSKTKQCVDCINDNTIIDTKKANKNTKSSKLDDNLDKKKCMTKNSSNKQNIAVKTNTNSKNYNNPESKPTNKYTTNKNTKSDRKNNANAQIELVNNGRTQPKRKSKEKSYNNSYTQRTTTSIAKAPNKTPKTKSAQKLISNNTSMGSISTMITRSREKLSFNLSQGDYSSMNLSNISNRSLRLRQRLQRNKN